MMMLSFPWDVSSRYPFKKPFITCMMIPTGVGASQGGYGGDATVWMNLLASVSDALITHPNVANAAMLQDLPQNVLYTEGAVLDGMLQGHIALEPLPAMGHRIGVIFDAGMPERMLTHHRNVLLAHASVYGLPCIGSVLTEQPLGLELVCGESGISMGSLSNAEVLLQAGKALLDRGATALVVCSYLEGPAHLVDMEASYRDGQGVDPIGGLEAIISHVLVKALGVPVANVPVFSEETAAPVMDKLLTAQVAPEFITPSFAGCVLRGIRQAPPFRERREHEVQAFSQQGFMTVEDVSALVVPYNALGGVGVFAALEQHIPIIAVRSNQTVLEVTPDKLLQAMAGGTLADVVAQEPVLTTVTRTPLIEVQNYLEAAGLLQLWRMNKYPVACP
ncbi:MAG: DUF3326 domain-containing protein [Vampirovibrionales bacterium]